MADAHTIGFRAPSPVMRRAPTQLASEARDPDALYRALAPVRRWVFTITHHRIVDERRWHARRSRLGAADIERLDDRTAPDAMSAGPDPELVAALAELTPDQRDVLGLRLVADLPVADVARILRKRPNAVKALQHRATSRLAEVLGD